MRNSTKVTYDLNNTIGLDWLVASLKEEMYGHGHNLFLPILDSGLLLFMDLYRKFLYDYSESKLDYYTISVDKKERSISKKLKGDWKDYYKIYLLDSIYDSGETLEVVVDYLVNDCKLNKKNIVFMSMFKRAPIHMNNNFSIRRLTKHKIKSYSALSLYGKDRFVGYGMDLNQKGRFGRQLKVI